MECVEASSGGMTGSTEKNFNRNLGRQGNLNKLTKMQQESQTDGNCSICMTDLCETFNCHPNRRLSCGHIFHNQCIKKWLVHSVTCPNCRARVKTAVGSTSQNRYSARRDLDGHDGLHTLPQTNLVGSAINAQLTAVLGMLLVIWWFRTLNCLQTLF